MYGYLEYQQQLLGEIYAKYIPPPTPAELFVQKLGGTSRFNRLTKTGAITGEFGFDGGNGYLTVVPADFLKNCGRDYVVLIKTVWVPTDKRRTGILREMLNELMDIVLNNSACSVMAFSRPFEFAADFNPITDAIPNDLKLQYDTNVQSAEVVNNIFTELGFYRVDQAALRASQDWEDEPEAENPASQCFIFKNTKSTWMLNSFFDSVKRLK